MSFDNALRNVAISSWDGGQLVSQVLQWNTSAPDFKVSSNSSRLNVTVWLWSFGQTISEAKLLLIVPHDHNAKYRDVFAEVSRSNHKTVRSLYPFPTVSRPFGGGA